MPKPMTEREIARALGVSHQAIHKSLKSALRKLAKDKKLADALEQIRDTQHRLSVQLNTAGRVAASDKRH